MIYLDNAATSFPKAPGVAAAMSKFLASDAANPGRAGHRMAVAAERMLDEVRLKLTRLFEGQDHHRMIFAMNCTDAINMALKGVLTLEGPTKTHVITTVLEHNSVSRPLVAMEAQGQIELTRVTCDDQGFVDPDEIRRAIKPATRLIALTHASNALGTVQDAAAVGRIAREHDLLFMLDAAQTAGAIPISIAAMNVDLLAFPGHKSLLGPTGTGGLYVGSRCPEPPDAVAATHEAGHMDRIVARKDQLRPWREGGTGGDSSTPTMPPLFPYYLEGGTPNTVGIAGLLAGLDYVVAQGIDKTIAHERALVQRLIEAISDLPSVKIFGSLDPSRRVGAVSITLQGYEPSDLGSILDDSFDIAVRPGLHCAPYAHRRFGTFPSGMVRISPGPFNTEADIDAVAHALRQIAG